MVIKYLHSLISVMCFNYIASLYCKVYLQFLLDQEIRCCKRRQVKRNLNLIRWCWQSCINDKCLWVLCNYSTERLTFWGIKYIMDFFSIIKVRMGALDFSLPGQWSSPGYWAAGSLVPWPGTRPEPPCDFPPHLPPVPPISGLPHCRADAHQSRTPVPVCYWPHSCLSYNRRQTHQNTHKYFGL